MILPPELQPSAAIDIPLPSGAVARLPVCHPVFVKWEGKPVEFDFGKKPILNYDGEACFAELAILRVLLKHGWNGVWVETYGGTYYLNTMPKNSSLRAVHVPIPVDKERILQNIWKAGRMTTPACFDVFVWRDSKVLFCEAKHKVKHKKDTLTDPQVRFIAGALACGVAPESLLIAEWSDQSLARRGLS
jgi:hypothetical protein